MNRIEVVVVEVSLRGCGQVRVFDDAADAKRWHDELLRTYPQKKVHVWDMMG